MKKVQDNSIQLLSPFLRRQKTTFSKEQVIAKLGRFLTFRELQYLHKNHGINDADLGFYMDMKATMIFSENHINRLTKIHENLK